MATVAESPESNLPPPPDELPKSTNNPKAFDEMTPWVDYAVHEAALYQKTIQQAAESTYQSSESRISRIVSTASSHFQMTLRLYLFLNSLGTCRVQGASQDVMSDYAAYEDLLFAKVKEGVNIAAKHPKATLGVSTAVGFAVLKRMVKVPISI